MLKNYFKIAWRNLTNNKGFTSINLIGLSIGVAACILISIYILHETSYDAKVPNAQHIYRILGNFSLDDINERGVHFSAMTARTLKNDFEEVENSGRLMDNNLFYGAGSNEIRIDGQTMQHHEEGFSYADQSMVDMMGIKMVYGEAQTALSAPKTMVISQRKAEKYFPKENPVGKVIYLNGNNDDPFKIGGVMENFASNSHLAYDFLLTLTDVEFGEGEQTRWTQDNYYTYLQLKPGTEAKEFEKRMSHSLINNYLKPAFIADGFQLGERLEEILHFTLQPLTKINLYSADINFESGFRNDIKVIWIFGLVALFILAIASINFVNLSTAKSANRAKEVGLRKVIGSMKKDLIGQFLTESVLLTAIAFLIGLGLSYLLLPHFRNISGIQALNIPIWHPIFIPMILVTILIVGLLAGLYPAFYLSGFKPINVLKGKLSTGSKSSGLRNGLVVFQFAISILLIIGTLIVNNQLNYILNAKVGFEKDQVIQVYGTNMLNDQIQTFKEELLTINGVSSVSISDYLPLEDTKRNGNSFTNEGRENLDESVPGQAWIIDEDYIKTLGINLIAGRDYDKNRSTENEAVIVNQAMIKKLHLEDPIGKKLSRFGRPYEIIGLVENFNYNTMKEEVYPLAMFFGISPSITSIKINTTNLPQLIDKVEQTWQTFAPNLAFRYEFMDLSFAKMYENVEQVKSIFTSFAILAILVACLGLFALSAYMAEQRTKEMGIRKVLGATTFGLLKLLSLNFVKLILIAFIVAAPLAYYLANKWLQDFAYRINIQWWVFGLAAFASIGIAILTVSYQSLKAALVNPVESLRQE